MSGTDPRGVLPPRQDVPAKTLDEAAATVRALLPPSLLVLLARHLDAMRLERAIGDLQVSFHLYLGDVRSCSFSRTTHWQRSERPEAQAPGAVGKP